MHGRKMEKSLILESEPVLHWPKAPAEVLLFEGYALSYMSMDGMTYSLQSKKACCIEMIKWDPDKISGWRDVFSDSQLQPSGLLRLARLAEAPTVENVCRWVSTNGPLGFQPSVSPIKRHNLSIPQFVGMGQVIPHWEPIDCIRSAARRAANVARLWSALKKSYSSGESHESVGTIKKIVTFIETDPLQPIGGMPVHYRVLVNGEPRRAWPMPQIAREWRELVNILLADYIHDHVAGPNAVQLVPRVQKQNIGEESRDRAHEHHPGWNLKPALYVSSALTAYYLELLMVMRRFRSCKTCGKDVSHQRDDSTYCAEPSTCRTKDWHRRKSRRNQAGRSSLPGT